MTLKEFRELTASIPGTAEICIQKPEDKLQRKFRLIYKTWQLLTTTEQTNNPEYLVIITEDT